MTEAHGRPVQTRPTKEELERAWEYKIRRRSAILMIALAISFCALVFGMVVEEIASDDLSNRLEKVAKDPYGYMQVGLEGYADTIAFASRMKQIGLVAVIIVNAALILNLETAVGIRV